MLSRFGVPVAPGALSPGAQEAGSDSVPAQEAIVEKLNDAGMVVKGETGWRVEGRSAWLWAAAPKEAPVYNVSERRGFEAATVLLDEDHDGTLVRDCWVACRSYDKATHQNCPAHLPRRCVELSSDLAGWARGAARQVKEILLAALGAREPAAGKRGASPQSWLSRSSCRPRKPVPSTPSAGWSRTSPPSATPSSPSSTIPTSTPPISRASRLSAPPS